MKLNRILTHQTIKELSKSIGKIADMLQPDAAHGIECKKIMVSKETDKHDIYHVEINIRLSLLDESNEIGEVMERFK
jgi:hypothetical protein